MNNFRFIFRSAEVFFLVLALLIGTVFIFAIPPLWGFDESSHFSRAYQISQGDIIPDKNADGSPDNKMPSNFNTFIFYAISDIGEEKDTNIFTRKDINDAAGYEEYTKQKFSDATSQAINPATYSPAAYPVSIILIRLASVFDLTIGQTLILSRIGSLLTYVFIVVAAIHLLRNYRIKWLIVAITLMPVPLVQAAVLSADTVINALSILFFAVLIRLFKDEQTRLSSGLTVLALSIAIIIPFIKINYVFLSFSVFLIPFRHFKSKNIAIISKIITSFLAGTAVMVWSIVSKATANTTVSPRSDGMPVSSTGQIGFLLEHPLSIIPIFFKSLVVYSDTYIREMIGILGWNYVQLPFTVVILSLIIVLGAGLYAKSEILEYKKQLFIICGLAALSAASIFASLYVAFTPVAKDIIDGVQGRYMIPMLLPVVMLIACYTPAGIAVKSSRGVLIVMSLLSFILLISTAYYMLATY